MLNISWLIALYQEEKFTVKYSEYIFRVFYTKFFIKYILWQNQVSYKTTTQYPTVWLLVSLLPFPEDHRLGHNTCARKYTPSVLRLNFFHSNNKTTYAQTGLFNGFCENNFTWNALSKENQEWDILAITTLLLLVYEVESKTVPLPLCRRHKVEMYSCNLILTSAVEDCEWSASHPDRALPLVPLHRRLGGHQSWSGHRD
jgi:hypothetical protein